jgi:hypothetical protein
MGVKRGEESRPGTVGSVERAALWPNPTALVSVLVSQTINAGRWQLARPGYVKNSWSNE